MTPTALIVDDNFYNRDITDISLTAVGFSTEQIADGKTAIDVLQSKTFDLLAIDLQMPFISGEKVLQEISGAVIHKAMYIIVITANSHRVTPELEQLADFIMYKPISVKEFGAFVNRIQSKKGEIQPRRTRDWKTPL